jgi:NAD(P)-dependent dehydrogenase (short-subunit alcohol dehydrogenase family)
MRETASMEGRIALVTGAGSGIGRATAKQFDALGATVIATDVNLTGVTETVTGLKGLGHVALVHDVTDVQAWQTVVAEAENRFGRLDFLINNAGIMLSSPFTSTPIDHLRRQFQINVEGPFIGMQTALPLLERTVQLSGKSTAIVNVSSVFGQVSGGEFAAYSASKGAIRMLSRAVATEVAAKRVRVNTIHPGPIQTSLGIDFDPPRKPNGDFMTGEEILALWAQRIPAGRMGKAREVAAVIAFLASESAEFIIGAEITVDGGYTAI